MSERKSAVLSQLGFQIRNKTPSFLKMKTERLKDQFLIAKHVTKACSFYALK